MVTGGPHRIASLSFYKTPSLVQVTQAGVYLLTVLWLLISPFTEKGY
jgi:hypothetical protein